eukprot:2812735-Pyramimonas_sp.AAC.1
MEPGPLFARAARVAASCLAMFCAAATQRDHVHSLHCPCTAPQLGALLIALFGPRIAAHPPTTELVH